MLPACKVVRLHCGRGGTVEPLRASGRREVVEVAVVLGHLDAPCARRQGRVDRRRPELERQRDAAVARVHIHLDKN